MARAVLGRQFVSCSAALDPVTEYYRAVAPFYDAEMALRDDLPAWRRLVASTGARTVLDLGTGGGRLARALGEGRTVVGLDVQSALLPERPGFTFVRADLRALPFAEATFDLAVAANDPFAHLLSDEDRSRALDEASRVARGVVIDGLYLTAADDARARADGCVRQTSLPDGVVRHETWRATGDGRYRTTYRYLRDGAVVAEATTEVRAWSSAERALRDRAVAISGGLDGRVFDPDARNLVITIGGSR